VREPDLFLACSGAEMRALTTAVGVILTCGSWIACTSSTQNVTGPSTSRCPLTAVAEPAKFGAGGGSGTLTITTNRECSWSATSSDNNWLQVGAESSGQGTARVAFTVTTNANPSQRRGVIAIGEQQVAISQDAAACVFTVPSRDTVSSDGERRTLNVTANGSDCSWTARSETEWLTIVQGSQGSGSGQVVYEAQPTKGPVRSGELTIAGQRVTVTQGGGCAVAITPTSQAIGSDGGSGEITVTTDAACAWSVQGETGWISITSARSGSGPATVAFRVGPWNGPARTGTLRIGEQVFTVTQGSGCRFSIDPESYSVASTGGSSTVAVTSVAGCEWTATSSASWITIASGGSRNGNGTVQFTVAPTNGPARSGTLTIAGRSLVVSQASGCTFSINPESYSVASTGGSSAVAVTAIPECGWTATSSASWITISSGGSGNGNGTVQFAVAPTTGPARSGTLTIAGRTFMVSQSSGCTFSISPTSQNVPYFGGSGSVAVATSAGCPWTAASSIAWARITAGQSGTSPGPVAFTVDETPSSLPRSGTMNIAGQTFTIGQEGAPCAFVLSPPSAAVGSIGGSGTFEVNTKEACTWSATSNDAWLHVTAGGSGSSDGTVSFSADLNPGPARAGTIVVGGRLFTVSQAAVGTITGK
jgi:Putative binding domain, N-terminal/Viral BACON domain